MLTVTDRALIDRVLADDAFAVLPAVTAGSTVDVAWLRATAPRFAEGEAHARRRALVEELLDDLDLDRLRAMARRRAEGLTRTAAARTVPVASLAQALGMPAPDEIAALVAVIAPGYPTGDGGGVTADAALVRLVTLLGGRADEPTAAVISLLVQAFAATAALIEGDEPPVPRLRRIAVRDATVGAELVATGTDVVLDIAGLHPTDARDLTFGGGRRPCPGRDHALAIVEGVLSEVDGER
jgi:cytochrome P450